MADTSLSCSTCTTSGYSACSVTRSFFMADAPVGTTSGAMAALASTPSKRFIDEMGVPEMVPAVVVISSVTLFSAAPVPLRTR